MKKIKHILLSSVLLASTFCGVGCGEQDSLAKKDVPDYSGYTHEFDFYGYSSLHRGYYTIDDVKYDLGENFMTVEQYQLYKDVGMTIFYTQSALKIDTKGGREAGWEKAKVEIDKFRSIGMDKCTLYDEDLSWLGLNDYKDEPLVGEGMRFATNDELDEYVYSLVSLYADYPGVYGVALADEPKYKAVEAYGEVYNSILRVNEKYGYNLYPDYNLNPLNLNEFVYQEYYPHVEGTAEGADPITGKVSFEDGMKRYQAYIEGYMDSLNPSAIQYDDYPLRNGYLSPTYIPCMQYVAEVAKERGIKFHMVTQTFGMYSEGSLSTRPLTKAGANWLNNMLLGFGVSEISYFTYYTRMENRTDGESFIDGQSFVDMYGKPTNIYYMMKEIIANNKKFAPAVLQFRYQKSGVWTQLPLNYSGDHLRYTEQNVQTYEKVKSVSINKECAMVNELYDKENDRYMYMAMNIVDPEYQGSPVYQTITLEFASEYKYALVYKDGEQTLHKLKNGKLSVKGAPGDASFVIPF